MKKKSTSIRISERAARLLKRLAAKLGISQSAVIEIAIREKAEREGIDEQ